MPSTQELSIAENEAKLRAKEAARLKLIADGLNKLTSLDTDKVSEELPNAAYAKNAHESLRRLMEKGNNVPYDG